MIRLMAAALFLAGAGAAKAHDLRPACFDRPGLADWPCTLDPGHFSFEVGLADWTRESDASTLTDTLLSGDMLLRYGLDAHSEAQIGWTAYGHVRERDKAMGAIQRTSRPGDVILAVRRNLIHPDGSGFSAALMPYATLPTGRRPVGAGDWGAGLLVPITYQLSDVFTLSAMPEIDAAVDADGDGRHLAYSGVAGVGIALSEAVSATLELSAARDDDPSGHATATLAALSFGWQPNDNLQFDVGSVFGLNRNAPDAELYMGVARRF